MTDEPIGFTVDHTHPFPDVDADPGTYRFEDGCAVYKREDGSSVFVPNGITNMAHPIFAEPSE